MNETDRMAGLRLAVKPPVQLRSRREDLARALETFGREMFSVARQHNVRDLMKILSERGLTMAAAGPVMPVVLVGPVPLAALSAMLLLLLIVFADIGLGLIENVLGRRFTRQIRSIEGNLRRAKRAVDRMSSIIADERRAAMLAAPERAVEIDRIVERIEEAIKNFFWTQVDRGDAIRRNRPDEARRFGLASATLERDVLDRFDRLSGFLFR